MYEYLKKQRAVRDTRKSSTKESKELCSIMSHFSPPSWATLDAKLLIYKMRGLGEVIFTLPPNYNNTGLCKGDSQ